MSIIATDEAQSGAAAARGQAAPRFAALHAWLQFCCIAPKCAAGGRPDISLPGAAPA